MNMIDDMKKNRVPYYLLKDKEIECLMQAKTHLLSANPRFKDFRPDDAFHDTELIGKVFRIKSDYQPEIVECGVYVPEDGYKIRFHYKGNNILLHEVIDYEDWYGLKWSDGVIILATEPFFKWRRQLKDGGKYEAPEFVLMKEVK